MIKKEIKKEFLKLKTIEDYNRFIEKYKTPFMELLSEPETEAKFYEIMRKSSDGEDPMCHRDLKMKKK